MYFKTAQTCSIFTSFQFVVRVGFFFFNSTVCVVFLCNLYIVSILQLAFLPFSQVSYTYREMQMSSVELGEFSRPEHTPLLAFLKKHSQHHRSPLCRAFSCCSFFPLFRNLADVKMDFNFT